MSGRTNWAGNYTYAASALHEPQSLDELSAIVRRAGAVKVVGTRHTFNGITDTRGEHISLVHFDHADNVDRDTLSVTIGGGVTYDALCAQLHRQGFALHNLASLAHISVAGAVATATHGSGDSLGNLATAVSAIELMTTDGELVQLSRAGDGERFRGAVVSLGALGVVTKLTLDVVPAFAMRQHVYEALPLAALAGQFDDLTASAYSVSLFTDWRAPRFTQVWRKHLVTGDATWQPEPTLFGAALAPEPRHPIASLSAESCTQQLGIVGPWYERLPHFRADATPSSGNEIQSEYYVPRRHAVAALETLAGLSATIGPLVQASEVRTIAADDLWMSPCRGEPCTSVHFTWVNDLAAVRRVLPVIEHALARFDVRPHWGKLFTTEAARLEALFPRLGEFRALARELDPAGKLHNPFLDDTVFGGNR